MIPVIVRRYIDQLKYISCVDKVIDYNYTDITRNFIQKNNIYFFGFRLKKFIK